MIDFKSLQFVVNNNYSFVGIDKRDGALRFCLPKGFSNEITKVDAFTDKRDLFFLFYKILNAFKEICVEKGYLEETSKFSIKDRDGVINSAHGSEIQDDGDDLENIFYSKLDIIGSLLNAYDEQKILALAYRLGRSDKFDVSQIHRYLHQAIYLQNNAAYVDQMILSQQVVQFESTDIVAMYCYLFCEIEQQLKEVVIPEVTSLAERFRQHYLGSEDSLFDEQSYEQVLDILKDALETINNNTPIKDTDYWQYYEAIEIFLYGNWNQSEAGEIWGIENFNSVWESMCLTYLVKTVNSLSLLYLDTQYVSPRILERVKLSVEPINLSRIFQINTTHLVPDAILFSSITSQIQAEKSYRISSANKKWNDYRYQTLIGIHGIKYPKVGYVGQAYDCTIEKLEELYQTDSCSDVIINAPLPKNFYSFWEVPDHLDSDHLHKMYYFNHFFYLALKKQITDWDRFYEEILQPLGVVFGLRYNDSRVNVFTHSLLRDYTVVDMRKKFSDFIQQVFTQYKELFEVIDVKYLTADHFCDHNKMEDIKRRSVRKQFVYEYLLQKALERRKDQFSSLSICSSFWLPSYRPDDSNLLEDGSSFMDDYIQLKNVNFIVLAESYLV